MSKKDFVLGLVIGGAVGLLSQPIISNILPDLQKVLPARGMVIHILAFLVFFIVAPVALFIASILGRITSVIYQFAKFAAVGTLNSFVDFGVLNTEIWLSGIDKGGMFLVFKAVSFIAGTTNSYFWNRFWTFQSSGRANAGEAVKFYSIAILGGLVNVGLAGFVVNYVGHAGISDKLWANIGALVGIFSAFLWNFLGYKFIVFRKQTPIATTSSPSI